MVFEGMLHERRISVLDEVAGEFFTRMKNCEEKGTPLEDVLAGYCDNNDTLPKRR